MLKTRTLRNKEQEFHDFFINNSQIVLKKCSIVSHEFCLYPAMDILTVETSYYN